MKTTREQQSALVTYWLPEVEKIRAHAAVLGGQDRYLPGGKGDLPKRVRWDMFWATPKALRESITNHVYGGGGNDEHIDTLLRRVAEELGV